MESFQTKALYDEKKFNELSELWNNKDDRLQFNDWDYLYVIKAFYDQKDYERCLEVYKAFHQKFPDSDKLDDKMAWSLYHTRVKTFDFKSGNKNQLIRQAEYIIEHSSQSIYSPKWRVVKYMLDHIKKGDFIQILSDKDALKYLDMIDPDTLSTNCERVLTSDGKAEEKASDMETWYADRTKYLLQAGEYEQCIDTCNKALARFSVFHYNNDGWIKYRKAKALFAQGKPTDAVGIVKDILAHGLNHWCLFQLLYEIDISTSNHNDALLHAAMCALSDSSHEMRVSFYSDYADYLAMNGCSDEAALHRHLVLLIRTEKEWSLREKHQSWTIPDEIKSLNKQETIQKLKNYWYKCRDKNVCWLNGKIVRLLPEGKSGFIEAEDGKSYYFNSRDIRNLKSIPEIGMKARFTLMDKLDKRKGVIKPNAVQILIL